MVSSARTWHGTAVLQHDMDAKTEIKCFPILSPSPPRPLRRTAARRRCVSSRHSSRAPSRSTYWTQTFSLEREWPCPWWLAAPSSTSLPMRSTWRPELWTSCGQVSSVSSDATLERSVPLCCIHRGESQPCKVIPSLHNSMFDLKINLTLKESNFHPKTDPLNFAFKVVQSFYFS